MTIADKLKLILIQSKENRIKRLVEIRAPQVLIDGERKFVEKLQSPKFKFSGGIKGFSSRFLDLPFTNGFIDTTSHTHSIYFELPEEMSSLNLSLPLPNKLHFYIDDHGKNRFMRLYMQFDPKKHKQIN